MEVAGCEDRITRVGYSPIAEHVGAVLLSSVTSRGGKGQGSGDSAAGAASPEFSHPGAASPSGEIGLIGCIAFLYMM